MPTSNGSTDSARHVQREVLPIPDKPYAGFVAYDAKDPDSKFPAIEPLRPPKGAPNVLIVLIDDVGFGASSAFGGPVKMSTAERLAAGGLKYNRFHTTALCAPTRAALLSGRNHHSVGMATITETATRGARLQRRQAEYLRAAARNLAAERVLHCADRQMSRGPAVGVQSDGTFRSLADAW